MIVWGAKSQVANLGPQASRHCPTCDKERPFHLMLQYTVRHIWYVFSRRHRSLFPGPRSRASTEHAIHSIERGPQAGFRARLDGWAE
jgi:hypothetical protein